MWFEKVIGQKETIARLKEMVDNGRLPHALLISSKEGYGGLALALGLAEYVNCSSEGQRPCSQCRSCVQMSKLDHPDVHYTFPFIHDKSDDIRTCQDYRVPFIEEVIENPYITEDTWSAIISGDTKKPVIYANEADMHIERILSMPPVQNGYKISIIWQPEKMNPTCANRLLKTIEEPTGKALIILVSSKSEEILGTILSRCQEIVLPPIESDYIKAALATEYPSLSAEEIEDYAHTAMGNWLTAKQLVVENDAVLARFDAFKQLMRAAVMLNVEKIFEVSKWFYALSREECLYTLDYAQHMVRENLFLRLGIKQMQYLSKAEEEFSIKFSNYIHEANAEEIMEKLALAYAQIAQNANVQVVVFDLCFDLYFLLKRARPEE